MTAYFVAPRIATGPGAIEQLSALGAHRAAVIVDPELARKDRHLRLVEELGKSESVTEVIRAPAGVPTLSGVDGLAERVRSFAPDWIVAFGGGATIDAAKAAWVRYARAELPLESITPLVELGLRTSASFVAVPTTSGSGCDVSWSALVRAADGRAIEIASRELVPDWSLLDAGFPASMPPALTVDTAAEILDNAIEAIASEWSNPWSDAMAREALATAGRALPLVQRHPDDLDAREALHGAASMAGLASSNAQLGAAHALAVALGPESDVPYGRLVGVLLPYVTEFNYPSARERFERLSATFVASAGKDRSALSERLRSLWLPGAMPRTLAEAGVPRQVLEQRRAEVIGRARACTATTANPRVPSEEEYNRLLTCAFDGGSVTF